MSVVLFVFTILISFNSWSASAKRSPTPNYMPSGVCSFKSKSFELPTTDVRVYHVEVVTSRRGTGCLKGQTHGFWNKCDIRDKESDEGSDPSIDVIIKFRDNQRLKNIGNMIIPMSEIIELGWITDRKGNPKAITETIKRENIEIHGSNFHIVSKRNIKNLAEDKMNIEVLFYQPGDAEKNLKAKLLYQARCEVEITNKSY